MAKNLKLLYFVKGEWGWFLMKHFKLSKENFEKNLSYFLKFKIL